MQIGGASNAAYYPAMDRTAATRKPVTAQQPSSTDNPGAKSQAGKVDASAQSPAGSTASVAPARSSAAVAPAPSTTSVQPVRSTTAVQPAGAAAAAQTPHFAATTEPARSPSGASAKPGDNAQTGAKTGGQPGGDDPKHAHTDAHPSPIKSFAYGSLGLGHPEEEAQHHDGFYSAGKWLAAAITVGGLISLCV
jgi:hypothetical protein